MNLANRATGFGNGLAHGNDRDVRAPTDNSGQELGGSWRENWRYDWVGAGNQGLRGARRWQGELLVDNRFTGRFAH